MGYSLQANRKTKEGDGQPDRNAQFEHINSKVQQYTGIQQPVISVDTKKKELETLRTAGRTGDRAGSRKRCGCMIS
jgi:hypothetical protein